MYRQGVRLRLMIEAGLGLRERSRESQYFFPRRTNQLHSLTRSPAHETLAHTNAPAEFHLDAAWREMTERLRLFGR
jgi:hypothetical protein